jgi:pyridoxal phosphate enzyme (YggS family)
VNSPRRAELAANLADVRARIAAACVLAGRDPAEVSLVAVSKTFPASDVAELAALGQCDMAESRHQEVADKISALEALVPPAFSVPSCSSMPIRWHFIGRLQRNKAASVAAYAYCVQSVYRLDLVPVLERGAARRGAPLGVLVQVDLEHRENPVRGGVAPAEVPPLASAIATSAHLELRGVMSVAPRAEEPRAAFARLAAISEMIREEHPGATVVSAGMSGDLEAAIAEGSTLIRVGTALFGRRTPTLG